MIEVIKVSDCANNIGDYDVPIHNAIIIPDNATNGDVMYKMFDICLDDFKKTWGGGEFTDAWWNALYQKGGKE